MLLSVNTSLSHLLNVNGQMTKNSSRTRSKFRAEGLSLCKFRVSHLPLYSYKKVKLPKWAELLKWKQGIKTWSLDHHVAILKVIYGFGRQNTQGKSIIEDWSLMECFHLALCDSKSFPYLFPFFFEVSTQFKMGSRTSRGLQPDVTSSTYN